VREVISNAMLEHDGALVQPDLNDALMEVARVRAKGAQLKARRVPAGCSSYR
jgi:hypothetical protein